MRQRQQDFVLGLTAIVFLGLFLGTVIFLYPNLGARGQELVIHFRHEDGMAPLKPGSAVLLGGSIAVGHVRDIHIAAVQDKPGAGRPEHTIFVVRTEVEAGLKLYGDCQITTDQPAIGGSGFVTILNVGTPGHLLVQPIEGRAPQSFQAAIGSLSRQLLAEGGLVDQLNDAVNPKLEGSLMFKVMAIVDNLTAMTRELRTQLDPEQQKTLLAKLHLILDDVAAATTMLRAQLKDGDETAALEKMHIALDRLQEGLTQANTLLADTRPLIMDTLTSVAHSAQTLDQDLLVRLQHEMDPESPTSLTGKSHRAMDQMNASLDNLVTLSADGQRMLAVNRPTIEEAVRNLKATSEALLHGVQEVALNPSKLIWGPGSQRGKQELAFQAARSFADAASELNDATGRLEAVMRTLPSGGPLTAANAEELETVRAALRASFERFERAETALWDLLK
jgi:ABC-type transporter Mla subunit MlaD